LVFAVHHTFPASRPDSQGGRSNTVGQPGKDHLSALDGLRVVACLVIFVGHFLTWNKQDLPAWIYAARGLTGPCIGSHGATR
jgi:hypothetical protein